MGVLLWQLAGALHDPGLVKGWLLGWLAGALHDLCYVMRLLSGLE